MLDKIKKLFTINKVSIKQIVFLCVAIVFEAGALAFALMGSASYVYNKKIGSEVSISGYNLLQALLNNDYKNPHYGDIAVPFNYYAKDLTHTLSVMMLILVIMLAVCMLITILSLIFRTYTLNMIGFYSSFATALFILATFITSLFMASTKILPVYCGGNADCSMRSLLLIPSIMCFVTVVMHSLFEYQKLEIFTKKK